MLIKRLARRFRAARRTIQSQFGLETLESRTLLTADIQPFNNRILDFNGNNPELTTIFAGQKVILQISAQNLGDTAYNNKPVQDIAWLQRDGDNTNTEFMLTVFDEESASGVSIAPNGVGVDFHNKILTIPLNLPAGTYHIFSAWNTNGGLIESDNSNDGFVSTQAITVTNPFADITAGLTDTFISGALAGSKATATVSLTNPLNLPLAAKVSVDLFASLVNTLDGSEIALGNGTLAPTTKTLLPGVPATLKLSPTLPATLAEGDYFLIADVNVLAPIGGAVLQHLTVALPQTFHVAPNPIVAISAPDTGADESGGTGKFTITRSNKLDGALAVNFAMSGAAKRGVDYVLTVGVPLGPGVPELTTSTITLADGVASADIFVNPIDDAIAELTEPVNMTLTASGTTYVLPTLIPGRTSTVNIADDEPIVTVDKSGAANESGATATFTISRTGDTSLPLTVKYQMTGTATATTDYTLTGDPAALVTLKSAIIPAGADHVDITLHAVDDAIGEDVEHATLTILRSKIYHPVTGETLPFTVVDIADNEAHLAVAVIDDTAAEFLAPANAGLVRITRTGGDTTAALTVNIAAAGSAAASRYTLTANGAPIVGGVVTILPNADHVDINVVPIDDALAQGDQDIVLNVLAKSNYFVDSGNGATLQIIDDEPKVSVTASDATAAEPGTDTGTFTFTRTGSTALPMTVFFTIGGTAHAGMDYVAFQKGNSVTIPAGQASATVTVQPLSDVKAEVPETVILAVTPKTAYSADPATPHATVTITSGPRIAGFDVIPLTATYAAHTFHVAGANTVMSVAYTLKNQGTSAGNFKVRFILSKTGDINDASNIVVFTKDSLLSTLSTSLKGTAKFNTLDFFPTFGAGQVGSYHLLMQAIAVSNDTLPGNNVLTSLLQNITIA